MTKKNIDKIIATGTPLKKIILIHEDIARRKYAKKKLLTNQEFEEISNSFIKNKDIDLWNKFKKTEYTVSSALMNLQGCLFEVKMHYSNLRGYILNWNTIEHTELLVNSVLHEIKDPIERKKIAENGAQYTSILFSKKKIDKEGYINLEIDFEKGNSNNIDQYSLLSVMNNVKKDVTKSVVKWLSWEKALYDYINKQGFNIKIYKDKIQEFRNEIDTPIIAWVKYYGELENEIIINPNTQELLKKYAICPKIEELEINKKEYDFFKNIILEDE
ncbi:hypothetical protein [Tenacibaculum dicentrarchi]|uniref:hypothetical protein n=1 Tax=Tenacibaculum dicentrarchi TaxID=669041 RepID=UPI000C7A98B3|nr:hypothetical protein TDCHD05_160015 [Tenacibaculum dicentrarchi]